jgi:hypothetical protein
VVRAVRRPIRLDFNFAANLSEASALMIYLLDTGTSALTIWATLLGGLLVGGAFLVYSTSALAS